MEVESIKKIDIFKEGYIRWLRFSLARTFFRSLCLSVLFSIGYHFPLLPNILLLLTDEIFTDKVSLQYFTATELLK